MPHNLILVDTSAWLYALRKEFNSVIRERLDQLLKENQIITAGIIKLEILGGTKSEKEFQRLKMRLDAHFDLAAQFSSLKVESYVGKI